MGTNGVSNVFFKVVKLFVLNSFFMLSDFAFADDTKRFHNLHKKLKVRNWY